MSEQMVNLEGEKFQWLEKGTDKPVYIIYAKSEKKAYKQFISYLGKIGKLSSLENMERIGIKTPKLTTCYACDYVDSEDKFTSVALSQHPDSVERVCWGCYKAMIGALE